MKRIQRLFLAAGVVVFFFLGAPFAGGEANAAHIGKGEEALNELEAAREEFGWGAFLKPVKIRNFLLVIVGAAALGAALAFHPFAGRKSSVEELEQPKIIITYTVVGALIAVVVAPLQAMAFAIFGIGGLMRFRTILGAAKETGRVILAAIIGLLCGLEFWMAAILATAFAWILIFILESWESRRMVVRGVATENMSQTVEAYSKILRGFKCSFVTPRKNPRKGQVSFILRLRRSVTPEAIEEKCLADIPRDIRGTLDWPED